MLSCSSNFQLLGHLKLYHRIHIVSLFESILNKFNPIHNLISSFSKIHFILIFPFTSRSLHFRIFVTIIWK